MHVLIMITCISLGSFSFGSCQDGEATDTTVVVADTSDFVLPFPVGKRYKVSQGNNTIWSHSPNNFNGVFRYAYDFDMPVGTVLTASREGEVIFINDNFEDSDHTLGHENVLVIRHRDATYSRYIHIRKHGALVKTGATVAKGDTVALSGNSGYTLGIPHLHFDVVTAPTGLPDINAQSIRTIFKNSTAYPNTLQQNERYRALPYTFYK